MGGDGAFLVNGGFDRQVYTLDVTVGDIKVLKNPAKGTMACRNILILHIRHTTEKTARSGQRKSASIAGDMPSMTWIGGMHTRVARRVCRISTSGKSSRI